MSTLPEHSKKQWANLAGGASTGAPSSPTAPQGDASEDIPQSVRLVELAVERYRFGRTTADECFAVPRGGPSIVTLFAAGARQLMPALCAEYFRIYGKIPHSAARQDAALILQAKCAEAAPEQVYLRLAKHEDAIYYDLGTTDGQVIRIKDGTWAVVPSCPVLFRRNKLTAAMPIPRHGGSLDEFRRLVNITESDWPLFVGWWLSGLYPGIPHCVLMLGGEQGTGKSTLARFAVQVLDPSPVPLRSPPKNLDDWIVAASGSWFVVLDNLSVIPDWLADAICRAATGEGLVKRALFTDAELAVLVFRRVVVITSIDPGALKGDMADRAITVDLEKIGEEKRMDDADLEAEFNRLLPTILGALLDLAARVFAVMPEINLPRKPRMADFARILGGLDQVLGTNSVEAYMEQRGRIAATVIETSSVARAIVTYMDNKTRWEGPAGELFELLTPDKPPSDWPRNAAGMGGALRRLAPPLRSLGVEIIPPQRTDKRRRYTILRVQQDKETTAQTAQPPGNAAGDAPEGVEDGAVEDEPPAKRPSNRPSEDGLGAGAEADSGRLGGWGGQNLSLAQEHGPPHACRACGLIRWWSITGIKDWTCGGCHDPSAHNGHVIPWIGNQEGRP